MDDYDPNNMTNEDRQRIIRMRTHAMNHPTKPLLRLNESKLPGHDLIAWYLREVWGPWTDQQMQTYQQRLRDIAQRWDKKHG